MFTSFRIENFKGLEKVELQCDRLTVLIGPNSCGKTSVLEGVNLICQLHRELGVSQQASVFSERFHESFIYRRGADEPLLFGWRSVHPDIVGFCYAQRPEEFSVNEFTDATYDRTEWQWVAEARFPDGNSINHFEHEPNEPYRSELLKLASCQFYRMDPLRLSEGAVDSNGPSKMEANGSGLVRVLAKLRLNDNRRLKRIIDLAREVIPSLDDIQFDTNDGLRLIFDFKNCETVPGEMASEGTLLTLGIITALSVETQPRLFLIDDIDRALHPRAQRVMIDICRRMLKVLPTLQIIATTHSPYLLNCLEYDEVRVMHRDDEGFVRIGKFAEHPDFERWKEEFSPGEFWSLVGEEWLAKTLPKAAQP